LMPVPIDQSKALGSLPSSCYGLQGKLWNGEGG
jgi:hypothetical protein